MSADEEFVLVIMLVLGIVIAYLRISPMLGGV